MTLLDEPPVATQSSPGRTARIAGRPASWRFAVRLARRETRRRPGRTALASLLIAVPVFAMTVGSVLVRTDRDDWPTTFDRDHAGADVVVDPAFGLAADGRVDEGAADDLPGGTIVEDYVWTSTSVLVADVAPSVAQRWGTFTDIELRGDGTGQPVEVLDGRAPGAGEILIDPGTAASLGADLGDVITLERPAGSWTLVGIGRVREWHRDAVFVVPGFDRSRLADEYAQITTTYDLPDDTSPAEIQRITERVGGANRFVDPFFRADTTTTEIAWGWVGGVLALVAVGIIVAAAFATSARRQLVTIGQLAANGATPAVIRRTLALQGTWTGLIGSALGVAAGLAALPFARRTFEWMMARDLPSYRIGVSDLVIVAVTAAVAGTIAAAVPARSAARIPIMAALAGRRPLGRLPRWLVPTGVGLVAGGLGLAALSALAATSTSSDQLLALLIVVGIVAVVSGMVCATPLVVEWFGWLGSRASLSWRLALRSMARSRTRWSAVVAAIAVAVGGAVAAAAVLETTIGEDRATWIPTLPADTVIVDRWDEMGYREGEPFDLDGLDSVDVDSALREELAAIAPGATFEPLRVATVDPPRFDPATSGGSWPEATGPRIADPALVDVLGLAPADVRTLTQTGALLPVSPAGHTGYFRDVVEPIDGSDSLTHSFVDESGPIELEVVRAGEPYRYDYAGWGGAVITEATAEELGFEIAVRGTIVRYAQPLSPDQRASLREVAAGVAGAAFDAFVESGDPPRTDVGDRVGGLDAAGWNISYDEPEWRQGRDRDVWVARAVVLGAATLITLLVVGIGLSLAAAEGRLERHTLTVVGATPASMRHQAAARAATSALSGTALGVPTGFVPAWVLYRIANQHDPLGSTLGFPWLVVAALVVLVPLVVAAVAWIGAAVGQRLLPLRPARHD